MTETQSTPQSTLIVGATLIDGLADQPLEGRSLWIENGRIKAIGSPDELGVPAGVNVIDARGKYLIPGLMNAGVHLFGAITLELLARHAGHYEEVILEAAQVALKSGLTTVFDTWGPRRHLMAVRERINAGGAPGSRIFCGGNIIGFDGVISADFNPGIAAVASGALASRVNAIFVENVGRHLMWLTPEDVAKEVRAYIGKGIDFVVYASNEHGMHAAGAFLQFTPRVQELIVDEAHRAGLRAQAHSLSVEGLRVAVEAGADLLAHADLTGPTPIPETTFDLIARRRTGAAVTPFTQRRLDWYFGNESRAGAEVLHTLYRFADINVRNYIRSGAHLLLATDSSVVSPEVASDPRDSQWLGADADNSWDLSQGHFVWFKAMEEKGCAPMEILRAATRNIAVSYGKDKDLGTLEVGKIADVLILDRNPLASSENYRSIHMILKEGVVVDRDALPQNSILTKPPEARAEEEAAYKPALAAGRGTF